MSQVVEKIGRYQIVGELGKGAMGVVYKATDPNIERTVAIKTLRFDTTGTEAEEVLGRFKNEARAAGVLNHTNVVTIYDAGEQEGMFYLAMEFIEGQTLQALLKQEKTLAVERAANIVCQACAGLEYAHGRGIIHRDIKPANIMITGDGTVKIMDFGIAKFGVTGMTSTGQVVGTPNYMSPEQVKGEPLDGRTDLFSLGVVLYEALTGARPFVADNVAGIVYKIANQTPAAPQELAPSLHPGLSAVVMKALAKDPDKRFARCAEFARAIQGYPWFKAEGPTGEAPVIRFGVNREAASAPPAMSASGGDKPAASPPPTLPARSADKPAASAPPTPSARSGDKPAARVAQAAVKLEPAPVLKLKPMPPVESKVATPRIEEHRKASTGQGPWPMLAAAAVLLLAAAGAFVRWHQVGINPPEAATSAPITAPAPDVEEVAKSEKHPAARPARPRTTPAGMGELQISSTPFGASVKIDNKTDPDWVTPFTARRLKPGPHTVAFTFDNYQPLTRQAEVVAGAKLPLYVLLQPAQGLLLLSSNPAGAEIYIDGRDSGKLTPARITVNAGQHRIAIHKQGFKSRVTYATVSNGKTFNFAPALVAGDEPRPALVPASAPQPAAVSMTPAEQGPNPFRRLRRLFGKTATDSGVLNVRTRPQGAEIRLGNSPAPLKSPAKLAVAPGSYTMTLTLPGYKTITRAVQVERGKKLGVDEVFEPQ